MIGWSTRGSLRYFKVGNNYVKWVDLLLNNFVSRTTNNGYFSDYIGINRSAHQGCPLAPYLFIVTGQVMLEKIKENSSIKGICIGDLEKIIAQFADNTQLFLENRESVEKIVVFLNELKTNTGLKVNYEKSSIHRIGNVKKFECKENFVWDPGGLPILGVDACLPAELQYNQILQRAQSILNQWETRSIPLLAKVTIINSLIASLFVYSMQVLDNPSQDFYFKFDNMIDNYLWTGKRAKIKTKMLQQNKQQGSLKLVKMEYKNLSLKLAWLFRKENFVLTQLHLLIPSDLGTLFWDCSLQEADAKRVLDLWGNTFWIQIIVMWFNTTWATMQCNVKTV